jgi:two-component system chemotaxis sensor kinase CheA
VNERVLVIDDDPTSTAVIASVLEAAGYAVTTLASPIGATRAIRDNGIDVVVCDLNMPAMRGDAFARMFRKSTVLSGLRLVVVSAAPRAELDRLMTEGTVDGVVHKGDLDRSLVPLLRRLGR